MDALGGFVSYLDEAGAAGLTLVGLFSGVDPGVGLQVGRPVELSAADVAVVRLGTWRSTEAVSEAALRAASASMAHVPDTLTGVNRLVARQVALVAEGGLAAVTLVRLVTVDLDHVVF